jgi:nucleotide-binding universal stress UspA family protein
MWEHQPLQEVPMLRRILVPLDGTRFGDHALPYAIDLARRAKATVELVHVHRHAERNGDLVGMPQYQFQHIAEAEQRHDERMAAAELRALEEKAASIELRYDIEVRTRLLLGRTDEAILNEAQDVVADLIVMSTHARHGLARLRHGNLANVLVTHMNLPTLCVRPPSEDGPLPTSSLRRVVVPLDGSTFSEQIFDALLPLLNVLRAQATLLHVVYPRPLLSTGFDTDHRAITNRDQALAYLREIAERYRGRMPDPVLVAFEDAQPADLIGSLLDLGEYDMVAMATHGRSGLTRLIMGSVATEVLERTGRPVLLYRPRLVRLPEPVPEASASLED